MSNWPKRQVLYGAGGDQAVATGLAFHENGPVPKPPLLDRVRWAVRGAAVGARIGKRATCHTFRHSLATHRPRLEPRAWRRSEPRQPDAREVRLAPGVTQLRPFRDGPPPR